MDESPAPARRVQARGQRRKDAILETAVNLFARRGFRATGVIALANEVGLTHAGLLHHFQTKEALLLAVVAERDKAERADAEKLAHITGLDFLKRLPRAGETLISEPIFARLFTVLIPENLDPGEPLNDYFVGRYSRSRTRIATAIIEGQRSGEIEKSLDPELISTEVLAFMVGIQIQWLLDPDEVRLTETYVQFTNDLIERIATPGAVHESGPE